MREVTLTVVDWVKLTNVFGEAPSPTGQTIRALAIQQKHMQLWEQLVNELQPHLRNGSATIAVGLEDEDCTELLEAVDWWTWPNKELRQKSRIQEALGRTLS